MNKKHHTAGRIPKSNMKIEERGKIDSPITQIHDHLVFWLGTATSIKKKQCGFKRVFCLFFHLEFCTSLTQRTDIDSELTNILCFLNILGNNNEQILYFSEFKISPIPVHIPGNVSITMSGSQTMVLNFGKISMDVAMERKILGHWIRIPCVWGTGTW